MTLFLLVAATILSTSLAQIFQKRVAVGMLELKAVNHESGGICSSVQGLKLSVLCYFISSAVLLGAAFVLWFFVLGRLELSVAYPLLSLNIVVVAALSVIIFTERLQRVQVAGLTMIVLGVVLITSGLFSFDLIS